MKPVIVFDMNETLLDMSALDQTFARIFGVADGAPLRQKWFKQVLELALTATIIDNYKSFDTLADTALRMLARQEGREASADDRSALKRAQEKIPAYPDAAPGLAALEAAGFRLAVLTNSTAKSAKALLGYAELLYRFDEVISVDDVQCYKPAHAAYEHAANELGIRLNELVLVAAHSWDVAGALAAGCDAAFIARPEKALNPDGKQPRFQADTIEALAKLIVAA